MSPGCAGTAGIQMKCQVTLSAFAARRKHNSLPHRVCPLSILSSCALEPRTVGTAHPEVQACPQKSDDADHEHAQANPVWPTRGTKYRCHGQAEVRNKKENMFSNQAMAIYVYINRHRACATAACGRSSLLLSCLRSEGGPRSVAPRVGFASARAPGPGFLVPALPGWRSHWLQLDAPWAV